MELIVENIDYWIFLSYQFLNDQFVGKKTQLSGKKIHTKVNNAFLHTHTHTPLPPLHKKIVLESKANVKNLV